jgi:hypothetical protein
MLAAKQCNTAELSRLLEQKANIEATDLVCLFVQVGFIFLSLKNNFLILE